MTSSSQTPDDVTPHSKTAYTMTALEFAMGNELLQRSRWPMVSVIVTSVFLGFALSLVWPGDPPDRAGMAIRTTAMSMAIFCGLVALTKINRIRSRRRSMTNFDMSPFENGESTVEWNGVGIRVDTDDGHQLYRWEKFRSWCEDDTIFALFFGEHIYIVVPKRALTGEMTRSLKETMDRAGLRRAKLFAI